MATERQSPAAILAQTNLSGVVADIQDDPDAPDANWLTAPNNNSNVDVRTSFPSPTGNPTVGADLQEFRFQVRRTAGSGTVDPTARAELWENGVLVRAGGENTVTSDVGQVFSFTWNANELATADGSVVELKVVGTKSGGAPAKRSAVDVGAVEWNVTFTGGADILTADPGSFAWTGIAAVAAIIAPAIAGSYSWTGTAATVEGLTFPASSGAFTWLGTAATSTILSPATSGSFLWTGTDAALVFSIVMAADSGSYALTGRPASLLLAAIVNALSGSYTWTGTDATLIFTSDGGGGRAWMMGWDEYGRGNWWAG